MGFPDYFDKNLQSAAFLLQGIDADAFKAILSSESVGIAFDASAAANAEGQRTLDALVRLLARLLPALTIIAIRSSESKTKKNLERLAAAINPNLEIRTSANNLTRLIVVGNSRVARAPEGCQVVYAGSDNWLAHISARGPVGSGASGNPFAAGAAASFAVANIFRQAFHLYLPKPNVDEQVTFSLLEMQSVSGKPANPAWKDVDLGELHLVGSGAIGNGFLWAMRQLASAGVLHVIDQERLDHTNLQRYALTVPGDEGDEKVALAARWLEDTKIRVHPHASHWEAFAAGSLDRRFDRVAVAVDTVRARIHIQASLPRLVHNSWTQRGEAGISRHGFLGSDACMACLYMPQRAALNFDERVQRALRIPDQFLKDVVRKRLDLKTPNDRQFLEFVAQFGVPLEQLLPFEGKSLEELYHQGACGGAVLGLRDADATKLIEVPMAFQSFLAGVLLAADVYAEVACLRGPLPTRTQINLLSSLPELPPSDLVNKAAENRCICGDPDFIEAYRDKYPLQGAVARRSSPRPSQTRAKAKPRSSIR